MGYYYNPVHVHFQPGAAGDLFNIIRLPYKPDQILLLTRGGTFSGSCPHMDLLAQMKHRQLTNLVFEQSNPDITDLFRFLNRLNGRRHDLVIAIGGGSVLDMGKMLALFNGAVFTGIEQLRACIRDKRYSDAAAACKWIGMPTTAGTGSEVTPWATLWDGELGVKYSIHDSLMFAHAAVIDPELTTDLPLRVTVSTALDALCHATEAYWAKASNEISQSLALTAISTIIGNIGKAANASRDPGVRSSLALGSLLAGLAFSNTRTTACHSISYPLTLTYGIDHGIAAALTLSKVMRANAHHIPEVRKLYQAYGADSPDNVEDIISAVFQKYKIPSRLRDYKITEKNIEAIAGNAFTKGRMDNNPAALDKADVSGILHSIL